MIQNHHKESVIFHYTNKETGEEIQIMLLSKSV